MGEKCQPVPHPQPLSHLLPLFSTLVHPKRIPRTRGRAKGWISHPVPGADGAEHHGLSRVAIPPGQRQFFGTMLGSPGEIYHLAGGCCQCPAIDNGKEIASRQIKNWPNTSRPRNPLPNGVAGAGSWLLRLSLRSKRGMRWLLVPRDEDAPLFSTGKFAASCSVSSPGAPTRSGEAKPRQPGRSDVRAVGRGCSGGKPTAGASFLRFVNVNITLRSAYPTHDKPAAFGNPRVSETKTCHQAETQKRAFWAPEASRVFRAMRLLSCFRAVRLHKGYPEFSSS